MAAPSIDDTASNAAERGRLVRLKNLRDAALQRTVLHPNLQPQGFNGRWTRRQWAHASLFATLGALVAALVPGFSTAMQPVLAQGGHQTSMSLSLPPLTLTRQRGIAGDSWQTVSVARGETLSHVFDALGIPQSELQRVLAHPGVKTTLTRLAPGTELAFDLPVAAPGQPVQLRAMRFNRGEGEKVMLDLSGETIREVEIKRDIDVRTVVLSGKVGRSLFRSARKVGLTGSNINQLTDDIFKYDIDFNDDVDADDTFSVVVDQTWADGELVKTGPVLAAAFTVDGKLHSGFRFDRNGKPEYFTAEGRPLKKSFIRMPIPYARLSSSFGARRHPVLGRMRMHKGVDYAAGSGTPIQAAGDARVQFVGWQGGYGRAVVLDHGRGYTTLYGHMSRFGKIKPGQRVPQGTVIGYVGSTGMSTGPHLHYEFRINGVHRNPLSITMPPPEPLGGQQLAAFRSQTTRALAKIRTVENIIYADVDAKPAPGKQVAAVTKGGAKKG